LGCGAQRVTTRRKGTVRTTHRNEKTVELNTHVYGLSNEPVAVRTSLQRIAGWDASSGRRQSGCGLRNSLTRLDLRVTSIDRTMRYRRAPVLPLSALCHHEC